MGDDGKGFSVEDQVYPITKNVEEQNSTVLLKKLTRYFDSKKMEYKDQPNIKFLLKVTNPKLDEIAKDEKSRVEFKEYLGHSYQVNVGPGSGSSVYWPTAHGYRTVVDSWAE